MNACSVCSPTNVHTVFFLCLLFCSHGIATKTFYFFNPTSASQTCKGLIYPLSRSEWIILVLCTLVYNYILLFQCQILQNLCSIMLLQSFLTYFSKTFWNIWGCNADGSDFYFSVHVKQQGLVFLINCLNQYKDPFH